MDMELDQHDEIGVARFSDRVVAFTIDYVIFGAACMLSMKAVFPEHDVLINPHGMKWSVLWVALFLLYQAVWSCEGRVTIGKRILGLRVVDLEGEPLSLPMGILRALGFLPSSFLAAGYLWYFANPARQTWHDMMAGSVVVEAAPKGAGLRSLVKAGAVASILAFSLVWTWDTVVAEHYYRNMTVANAYAGLHQLGEFQKMYKSENGRYAGDLLSLAEFTGAPDRFLMNISGMFDPNEGIRIELQGEGCMISATARDKKQTPVSITFP